MLNLRGNVSGNVIKLGLSGELIMAKIGKYDSGTCRGSNMSQYSANIGAYIEMYADVLMHVIHHQCVLPKRTTLGPIVCPFNTISLLIKFLKYVQ